jgi:4-amino-4-deoxy-L-arabinose transferase-like glycosyltransferase
VLRGREFRTLALIFLLSAGVRCALMIGIFSAESGTPYLTGDAYRYAESAVALVDRAEFTDRGELSCYQGPGYTAFAALFVILFSSFDESIVAAQVILSGLSACLVYSIAVGLFSGTPSEAGRSGKAALVSGIAAALNFGLVSFSTLVMSETLAIFLLLLSVFFGLRSARTPGNRDLVLSALFLGFATLTRVAYNWYVLPFALVLLVYRVSWRRVLIFVCGYLLVLAPWAIRNRIQFGEVMLSRSANHYLLFYFVPRVLGMTAAETGDYQVRTYADLSGSHNGANEAVLDNYYSEEYLAIARRHLSQAGPWAVFSTWLKGTMRTAGAVYYSVYTFGLGIETVYVGDELRRTNIVNAVRRAVEAAPSRVLQMLLITELGLMLLQLVSAVYVVVLDRSNWRRNVFLLLSIGYLFAVGGIMGDSRSRVSVEPFLCLCMGFAAAHFLQYLARNKMSLEVEATSIPLDTRTV